MLINTSAFYQMVCVPLGEWEPHLGDHYIQNEVENKTKPKVLIKEERWEREKTE